MDDTSDLLDENLEEEDELDAALGESVGDDEDDFGLPEEEEM